MKILEVFFDVVRIYSRKASDFDNSKDLAIFPRAKGNW